MTKNYDEKDQELEGVVPEFTLRGQTFRAKPRMPGDAFDDLAEIQSGNAKNPRLYSTLVSIIRRTLLVADRERWDELMAADLDVPIDPMTLAEIADDLVTAETGRPTKQLSPSGTTGGSTTTPSTETSGSPADKPSTSSRSVPV